MMRKFKVIHKLDASDLRNLCIAKAWYTRGTNAEYCHLFSMTRDERGELKELNPEDISDIAEDIFAHSDIERMIKEYGVNEEDILADMIFELYRKSIFYVTLD